MVGGIGGDGGPGIKGVTTPLKAQESFGTKFKRFVVRVAAGIARAVFAIASPVQSLLGLIDRIAIRSRSARVGRAPADSPRIAIVVLVEQGGHGGSTAAPLAGKIMASYLKRGDI